MIIINTIDKIFEKIALSRQRRNNSRRNNGDKAQKLFKWLSKSYDVDVQRSSTTGEYRYNSYNNTIGGRSTTYTWTEREKKYSPQTLIFGFIVIGAIIAFLAVYPKIKNFSDTYLGWSTIINPVLLIICFYALRNIVFRRKEGSKPRKILGYVISAVTLFIVYLVYEQIVYNFFDNYKFYGSAEWVRVGIQAFVTFFLLLMSRTRSFKQYRFFR